MAKAGHFYNCRSCGRHSELSVAIGGNPGPTHIKGKIPNHIVKKSLISHEALGLTVGALLYLICFTGTLAVLEHNIERWQQPNISEFYEYNAATISNSIENFLTQTNTQPKSLYVVLPTDDLPRAHVSDTKTEWYIDQSGSLLTPPQEGWLQLLLDLHIHLHMGETLGLILVSCLGAILFCIHYETTTP